MFGAQESFDMKWVGIDQNRIGRNRLEWNRS